MTSAIGSPLRVTRIDFPVFLTLSNRRRQVDLNFEMEMVSCISYTVRYRLNNLTMVNDYGQLITFARKNIVSY